MISGKFQQRPKHVYWLSAQFDSNAPLINYLKHSHSLLTSHYLLFLWASTLTYLWIHKKRVERNERDPLRRIDFSRQFDVNTCRGEKKFVVKWQRAGARVARREPGWRPGHDGNKFPRDAASFGNESEPDDQCLELKKHGLNISVVKSVRENSEKSRERMKIMRYDWRARAVRKFIKSDFPSHPFFSDFFVPIFFGKRKLSNVRSLNLSDAQQVRIRFSSFPKFVILSDTATSALPDPFSWDWNVPSLPEKRNPGLQSPRRHVWFNRLKTQSQPSRICLHILYLR